MRIKKLSEIVGLKVYTDSGDYFGEIEMRFFNLFTLAAVPFRGTPLFNPLLKVFEVIDSVVLRIPGIKWLAWQCIYILKNPKK